MPGGRLILRSMRRSWLGLMDAIFRTGYTAAELDELARRSSLAEPRVQASLMYLMLEARGNVPESG